MMNAKWGWKKLYLTNKIEERHHICAMHAHTWGWKWELNHNNKWQLVQTRRCFCPYPLITMLILCHHRHNIFVGGRCQPQNTSICFCPYPLITILVFLSTEAQQSHLKTPSQYKSVPADYNTHLSVLENMGLVCWGYTTRGGATLLTHLPVY